MKSPAELTDRFRSEGLKVTPQRQAVFRALHGNRVHPTAEAVHAEVARLMPTVSLRTVYQTLNDLASMGELVHLDLGLGSARFDPNLEPHHHLVCDGCGRVDDVEGDFGHVQVPHASAETFEVTRTEITFRGRCAACAKITDHTDTKIPTTNKEARKRHG
jgi:Fe2+ or Zn2+ uptake regulation protein